MAAATRDDVQLGVARQRKALRVADVLLAAGADGADLGGLSDAGWENAARAAGYRQIGPVTRAMVQVLMVGA